MQDALTQEKGKGTGWGEKKESKPVTAHLAMGWGGRGRESGREEEQSHLFHTQMP
jgi:hypothetical protein